MKKEDFSIKGRIQIIETTLENKIESETFEYICNLLDTIKILSNAKDETIKNITTNIKKDMLYAFLYNPMIEESGYITISIHKTKKGAEMAMKSHIAKEKKEWERHDKWEREEYGDEYEQLKGSEFGRWEDWIVKEIEVLK